MLNLNGFQVDIPEDVLLKKMVVFTIEFEYDNKILVCHTNEPETVQAALLRVLRHILSNQGYYYPITREALTHSAYITVQVEIPQTTSAGARKPDIIDIMLQKYDLVKKYGALLPGGHNPISAKGLPDYEKRAIKDMLLSLGYTRGPLLTKQGTSRKLGRPSKPVYQYEKVNGVWRMKRGWPSLTAAKKDFPGICISAISMCCKDMHKTAYGYKWADSPNVNFNF